MSGVIGRASPGKTLSWHAQHKVQSLLDQCAERNSAPLGLLSYLLQKMLIDSNYCSHDAKDIEQLSARQRLAAMCHNLAAPHLRPSC
jgi:hypothetical protein